MAESSMPVVVEFWFGAATNGKNCRNVTFKRRINSTPCLDSYKKEMDHSRFTLFGCSEWMYLNKDPCEKGKTAQHAVEAIILGLAVEVIDLGFTADFNTSAYVEYNPH